jgi:selenocysteine-specific elongation factor
MFNALITSLVNRELLLETGKLLAIPGHEIIFNGQEEIKIQTLNRRFEQNPFAPPSLKESQAEVGEEVLNALIEMGQFIPVATDVIFRKPDYDVAIAKIITRLTQDGTITLAEVRDLLNTSRKYAQALLEHLDAIGSTSREGDYRKPKKK